MQSGDFGLRTTAFGSTESAPRSLAKSVSWRIVGTLDTLILSFLVLTFLGPLLGLEATSHAENARTSSLIALTELATKIVLYFLHERAWAAVSWGVAIGPAAWQRERRRRSVAKTASWRVLASIDTVILALIFTGSLGAATSIGALEVSTKLILYFFHERAWARIGWGLRGLGSTGG